MDAVHAEDDAIARKASLVHGLHVLRDALDRQLHPGSGVDPRKGKHARMLLNLLLDRLADLIVQAVDGGVPVESNLAVAKTGAVAADLPRGPRSGELMDAE